MSLKVGGLFSGEGGIELAFKQAGFDITWANDFDQYAHKTYKKILEQNNSLYLEIIKYDNENFEIQFI